MTTTSLSRCGFWFGTLCIVLLAVGGPLESMSSSRQQLSFLIITLFMTRQ